MDLYLRYAGGLNGLMRNQARVKHEPVRLGVDPGVIRIQLCFSGGGSS